LQSFCFCPAPFAPRMRPCPSLLIRVHLGNPWLFKTFSVSLWLGEKGFSVTFEVQARHSLKFDFVFRNQWN
jgi:hypothetical protein